MSNDSRSEGEYPAQMKGLLIAKSILMNLSYIGGFEVFRPDYKFNARCAISCFLAILFWINVLNTLILFRNDIFLLIQAVCCVATSAPATYKLIRVIQKPMNIRVLWEFAVDVHRKNTKDHRAKILEKNSNNTLDMIKVLTAMFICAGVVFGISPMYLILFEQKRALFFSNYLPFVDHESLLGFLLNVGVQLIMSVFGISGNMAFDMSIALIISNYKGIVSIWECQVQQMTVLYTLEDSQKTSVYRRAFLRNVYIQLLDVFEYVNNLNDSFAFTLSLQVISSSASIVLALFSTVAVHWNSGYGFAAYSLIQIFMLCYIGTLVSTQKDRLCTILYESMWYKFDQHDQRVIQAMLQMSQNSCEMWIGIFAPLNLETAANIVQSVFSYYTMMVSFLEEQ